MKPRVLFASALTAALMLYGCADAKAPEDCSDSALAELEGKFATELLLTCADYRSVADCPGAPDVIAKYDGLRKEWTECR